MKILLFGGWRLNAGPENVNRSLIENGDKDLLYIKHKNRILRLLEVIIKIIRCDIVVFSSTGSLMSFKLAKSFKKKIAVLKHGDAEYENNINSLGLREHELNLDKEKMLYADIIICVSKRYAEWVGKRYPQYKDKISWVNNGVTISPRPHKEKEANVIALGGGNRSIKNNFNVCRAIQKLNNQGAGLKVMLFGRHYDGNPSFDEFPFVKSMGQMNSEEYFSELDKASLYIDAAYCEPFGLSIADAVNCHCSLLLSYNVGFLSIIKIEDCDVVHDCDDIDEIASKIQYLIEHGNDGRLLKSIDRDTCSEEYAYKRLKRICEDLINGNIYK